VSDKVESMNRWMDEFNEIIDFDLYLGDVDNREKYVYLRPLTSWILSVITHILLQLIDGSQIHLARAQQVACASITE
jgi:hypothetical protein